MIWQSQTLRAIRGVRQAAWNEGVLGNRDLLRKSIGQRIRFALAKPYFRLTRGMTLGARTAVIDDKGRMLLVRHTYAPGWLFPGGGVERGETCEQAAIRELDEEAAVVATGPLHIHGVFSNDRNFRGDHLVFYVLREFDWPGFTPTSEIAEARFFAPDALPPDVTGGTQRRIDELVSGQRPSGLW